MDDHQDVSERSSIDNLAFGFVFLGLLLGAAGVVLTTPGVAVVGLALLALGLIYFALKQVLAG